MIKLETKVQKSLGLLHKKMTNGTAENTFKGTHTVSEKIEIRPGTKE